MKKVLCLIVTAIILLCSCSNDTQDIQSDVNINFNVGGFSYESDLSYYEEGPGVKKSGFVNTEKSEISNTDKAVELAQKECTVKYDSIGVDYDSQQKIYRISFYKKDWVGGDQSVYIDQNGITLLIVYGE